MCGRVNVSDNHGMYAFLDELGLDLNVSEAHPRFNVSPGASLKTLHSCRNNILATQMRWGITPSWKLPNKTIKPMINARAETIWEKASFKNLIKSYRAVIPVNGFYEWRKQGNAKQAFYIKMSKLPAMALAAVYTFDSKDEPQACVVTTQANRKMANIHNRMPVLLSPEQIPGWLQSGDRNYIEQLCLPIADADIQYHAVSSYVNNARNEGPECSAPPCNPNLSLF